MFFVNAEGKNSLALKEPLLVTKELPEVQTLLGRKMIRTANHRIERYQVGEKRVKGLAKEASLSLNVRKLKI